MKKITYILALIFALFISACGSTSTISCEQVSNDEDMNTSIVAKGTFERGGETLKEIDLTMTFEAVNDTTKEHWPMVHSFLQQTFDNYESSEGIAVNINDDEQNHTYTVNFHINVDRLNETDLVNDIFDGFNINELRTGTEEQFRQAFTSLGFAC